MQLKSLVSIEIDTGKSVNTSARFVGDLDRINKSVLLVKDSVDETNRTIKKFFDDYAKESKQTTNTVINNNNKITNAYDQSTKGMRTFEGAARKAQAANDSFFTTGRTKILAFTAAITATGYAVQKSLSGIIQYSDAWVGYTNVLNQVSNSEEELLDTRRKVLVLSKETFSSLDGTARLYSEITRGLGDLGVSQSRVIGVTKTINNLFLAGGRSAASAAGAITQLNQGFASGVLRGDEFNSVAEGAPRILDALSKYLDISRGKLRDFAATGGITTEILVGALESYSVEAQRMVDITQRTFGQNSELAKTYLTEYVGNMEAFKTITAAAGNSLVFLASNLQTISEVVQSVALGIGVALIPAFLKYGFSLAMVAKESLFMVTTTRNVGGALATVTTRATLAQVGMNALALGARGATAAMALLGGPIGVITLAASALIYFSMQANEAEKDMDKLKAAGEGAAEEFKKFGEAQKTQALSTLREELKLATNQVEMYQKRLEYNAKTGSNPWYSEQAKKSFLELQANLERSTKHAKELQTTFDELAKIKFDEVEKELGWIKKHLSDMTDLSKLGLSKVGDGVLKQFSMVNSSAKTQIALVEKTSEEYKKQYALIQKQIALFGNKSEAVEFAYDLENGLVKGINKEEGKRILNLLKTKDAMEALKEEQDDLIQQMEDMPDPFAEFPEKLTKAQKELQKYNKELIKSQLERDQELAKAAEENSKKMLQPWIAATERLDEDFANAWAGAFDSFESFKDQFVNSLKQMVGEVIHQLTTKKFTDAISNFLILQTGGQGAGMGAISQNLGSSTQGYTGAAYSQWAGAQGGSNAGGNVGQAGSLISSGGVYGAIAVAVIAGVSVWNDQQDAKFEKLTAEYRQGTQSTGTLLGMANKKSDSQNESIKNLSSFANDSLNVNYSMLQELIGIRQGISGVATGFSRTMIGSGQTNIKEGARYDGNSLAAFYNPFGVTKGLESLTGKYINSTLGGFLQGVTDKVFKSISSKKTKIIDTGIDFIGQSLAEILESGAIDAFAYADTKTTKKVLGIKTSVKVKTTTEELNEVLLSQLGSVFVGASEVLKTASGVFGVEFDSYLDKLKIDPKKLSLKGLEGDELEKEIQSYLSFNLDSWAETLLAGTTVLNDFQKNGEGAFETYIRLSSETKAFTQLIENMGLKFTVSGYAAIKASQNMIELSGGIESLQAKFGNYYEKFFSSEDKIANITGGLTDQFEKMGIALPASREALKNYVSSLDLANEADAKRVNQIFDLANYLDTYYKEIERIESEAYDARLNATSDFANEFKSKIELFNKSIKEASNAAISAHSALIGSINSVGKNIKSSIASISGAVVGIDALRANIGKGTLEDQIANIENLNNAISNRYQNELKHAQDMLAYSEQLKSAADELLTSELSPLLSKDKLALAEKQFNEATPEEAIGAAQSYLREAREFFASSDEYTRIFQSVQDKLRTEAQNAQSAFADFENSAKSQTIGELTGLESLLAGLQEEADAELEKTMLELSKKLSDENQRLVDELKIQTAALNLVPEKLTETNTAILEQLKAAAALLEETRLQTVESRIQSAEATAQAETLKRRIEELIDMQSKGNKP